MKYQGQKNTESKEPIEQNKPLSKFICKKLREHCRKI